MKKAPTKHIEPTFDLLSLADPEVAQILKENRIALLPSEARHFQKELGRPLTLTELTIFSIQGSEHCSYRSSRRHLKKLPTKGKAVILGPGEDAGIVEIAREKNGKKWGLVLGHESHNSPSQIVPFEGAATGVGGCVRDIVCMGARVVGCSDQLRFGTVTKPWTRTLLREVVRGIAGYGNPLGVPNLGGDLEFDPSFDVNCLVNVVAAGVLREDEIIHSFVPEEAARVGYDIIVIGKPTDQSGFGGASFSSNEVDEKEAAANKGAVQEPNPFLERHLLVASYDLFKILKKKKALGKVSFKDMGAGGNVCASVEQVEPRGFGAEIHLEKVHTIHDAPLKKGGASRSEAGGLPPHVIACSETQERFCWICHPSLTKIILDHYNKTWELPRIARGAAASCVGKVTSGNYVLKYHGETLIDAPARVLTEGLSYKRKFKRATKKVREDKIDWKKIDFKKTLARVLAHPNIASRAAVTERYDKNVQGATTRDGDRGHPAVFRPLANTDAPNELKKIGAVIGVGGSSSLGSENAKLQAAHALVEAVTNVVATGATPLACTNCLNYGNPEKADRMAELVDGIAGLAEAATILDTPFLGGNVSLYKNVNPSAIVACVGRLDDADAAIPDVLQKAGNSLVLVGTRAKKLGGSVVLDVLKKSGRAFSLDLARVKREIAFMLAAKKIIASARDLHRGGVAVAALEMAFGSAGKSVLLDTSDLAGNIFAQLFSENPGFLVEVSEKNLKKLGALAEKYDVQLSIVGEVTAEANAIVVDAKRVLLDEKRTKLQKIWQSPLAKMMQE